MLENIKETKTCLVTGASGGIGGAIANILCENGYHVFIQGRNQKKLQQLKLSMTGNCEILLGDLNKAEDRANILNLAFTNRHIDLLVNAAGLSSFVAFEDTKPTLINDLIQTNLITPMLFTQAFVAKSTSNTAEQSAPKPLCVIQVGSAFGYIGYPGFSAYCASKFGLRGFTQALAREYSDTAIRFGYFAPRATNTDINAASVDDMNKALGNSVDSVNVVAKAFITFLNSNKREQVVGWPETLFARINGFIPKLVDNAIQSKLSIIKGYLKQSVQP
ncbi:MAG: short-subunit dehydrogenase [Paraglaciecola sp.]|jgi:short-subunit dehydrogenase